MTETVAAVFIRRIHPSTFLYIEGDTKQVHGGSGAHYIEVPSGKLEEVVEFFDGRPAEKTLVSIDVGVIGEPEVVAKMEWGRRNDGKTIRLYSPQNRQVPGGSRRHPAWTAERGFPQAPDDIATTPEAEAALPDDLRIFIVRLADGRYFASYAVGEYPLDWPDDPELRRVWDGDGVAWFPTAGEDPADAATEATLRRIFAAWARGRPALLYGPPGTGKTHVLSHLRRRLAQDEGTTGLAIDLTDAEHPFRLESRSAPIPVPPVLEWLTFHQSFTYEDFFLGLRPRPGPEGGTELRPRMGRLLERLHEVESDEHAAKSAVFFIDEINRGNAARIFGELMTFLDADYRAGGAMPLPVPLPSLDLDPEDPTKTQPIDRPGGAPVQLPVPWEMPQALYVVGTMNSVDRAAIPLDSALARRFERIELRPDLDLLASWLGLSSDELEEAAQSVRGPAAAADAWQELEPEACAVLLLDRLNHRIAEDLGEDFELGHALLRPLAGAGDRWSTLAQLWDEVIWPQLAERYVSRPDQLREALKVDAAPADLDYAFKPRTALGADDGGSIDRVAPVRLSELPGEQARSALRFLAL